MTQKNILLIDDDTDIIEQNKLVLESAGYHVDTAFSGKEGFKKAKENKPDLIVLDVIMEYANSGLELARKISREDDLKNIPIVLLTSDTNNPSWMMQDGHTWDNIVKFLDKPVNPKELLKVIESAF